MAEDHDDVRHRLDGAMDVGGGPDRAWLQGNTADEDFTRDEERIARDGFDRLKPDPNRAFAAPGKGHKPPTAADVIARNRTGAQGDPGPGCGLRPP
jgi:hypothetical protein